MKELEITTQRETYTVLLDDEDYEALKDYRWAVYERSGGYHYPVATVDGVRTYMHRLLCGQPGRVVDHINGNTLDNRRENLRSVSQQVNARNRHTRTQSNTGVLGVYAQGAGFIARVTRSDDSGPRYLGYFRTVDSAAEVVRAYLGGESVPGALLKRIAFLEAELARAQRQTA